MIRDDTERDVHPSLPTASCARCGNPLRYFMIDGAFCSYECAGVDIPDSSEHPATCWTWDNKPKMGFPTQEGAERMRTSLGVDGLVAYFCTTHHFWHVGYSDGRTETPPGGSS